MKVYLIMVENRMTKVHYCDSVWENKGDAEEHKQWLSKKLEQDGDKVRLIEEQLYKHLG